MSPLHRVLVEFERGPPLWSAAPAWPMLDRPAPVPPPADEGHPPEPASDPVGEAVTAALAEAEVGHGIAMEAAAARFAADLAAARTRWAEEEARALAEAIRRAFAEAEDRLAEAAAAVIEPFVVERVRQTAVSELRGALADLLAGGAGGRIAVSGPEDLLDALRQALDGVGAAAIDFSPADQAEVAITADMSVVRSRLAAWIGAFRRRLEGEA